jgi:hypothetical protein
MSQGFFSRLELNAERRSERQLKTLNHWQTARTVNVSVWTCGKGTPSRRVPDQPAIPVTGLDDQVRNPGA